MSNNVKYVKLCHMLVKQHHIYVALNHIYEATLKVVLSSQGKCVLIVCVSHRQSSLLV